MGISAQITLMTVADWDTLLDLNAVAWGRFRFNILMCVAVNRASEEKEVDACRKKQTAEKRLIIDIMMHEYPPSIMNETEQKKTKWRCAFRQFAIEFTRLLEMGSVRFKGITMGRKLSCFVDNQLLVKGFLKSRKM